jgi:hypothetical protein
VLVAAQLKTALLPSQLAHVHARPPIVALMQFTFATLEVHLTVTLLPASTGFGIISTGGDMLTPQSGSSLSILPSQSLSLPSVQ